MLFLNIKTLYLEMQASSLTDCHNEGIKHKTVNQYAQLY